TRRDTLLADVEALTRFEAEYRDRSVRALEADLAALRSRPPAAPGARPEPSDVEIPSPPADYTRPEPERREQPPAAPAFSAPPSAAPASHPAAFQPAASSAPPNPFASPPIAPASQPSFSSPAYGEPSAPDQETESRRGPDESTQAIDV